MNVDAASLVRHVLRYVTYVSPARSQTRLLTYAIQRLLGEFRYLVSNSRSFSHVLEIVYRQKTFYIIIIIIIIIIIVWLVRCLDVAVPRSVLHRLVDSALEVARPTLFL